MKLSEQQLHRFAELESCYSQYFYANLAPLMEQVRKEISAKQLEELGEYSKSRAGMVSMALAGAGVAPMQPVQPYEMARQCGKWNSMKAEDYIAAYKARIGQSKTITADLKRISDEWRTELVHAIGRDAYDAKSKQLDMDIAYAYAGYRVERLMTDRLVQQQMPKSSLEYIVSSAASGSLLGIAHQLQRSPLEKQIDAECERAYSPSLLEKGASKTLGFGMDVATTGGCGSWGNLARLAVGEAAADGLGAILEKNDPGETMEQLISKGVFGDAQDTLDTIRRESTAIKSYKDTYIQEMNGKMDGRMHLLSKELAAKWEQAMQPRTAFQFQPVLPARPKSYPDVPFVIRPGKEEEYLAEVAKDTEKEKREEKEKRTEETKETEEREKTDQIPDATQSGWAKLLSGCGLSDISSVGKNLGYVFAMLPDIVLGLFVGKTKSLNLKDSLLPLATILIGLFTKNPLIKMLLVGLGGLNLFNKAGHEILQDKGKEDGTDMENGQKMTFKSYGDEPLNTRITHPEIQGNYLLATVDRVPCTIRLPDTAVEAYHAGALPLNTLANAVLAKSDEMRTKAQENYTMNESKNQAENPKIGL